VRPPHSCTVTCSPPIVRLLLKHAGEDLPLHIYEPRYKIMFGSVTGSDRRTSEDELVCGVCVCACVCVCARARVCSESVVEASEGELIVVACTSPSHSPVPLTHPSIRLSSPCLFLLSAILYTYVQPRTHPLALSFLRQFSGKLTPYCFNTTCRRADCSDLCAPSRRTRLAV
jgi:hypothetical protein